MMGAGSGAQAAGATATVDPLSIAYYCTGHGLGHATRSIEVCKHLVGRGHTVTVITGAPARVFLQEVRSHLDQTVHSAPSKQRPQPVTSQMTLHGSTCNQ
jgi:UDP:flavonoid glycosyltransferase YjiC (YdhE family)